MTNKLLLQTQDKSLNGKVSGIEQLKSNLKDRTPHVRYGWVTDDGFKQQYKLTPLDQDPPEEAQFYSPVVYFVSESQEERLSEGTPPKSIQKQCEMDDMAFYNVVAESDALDPFKDNAVEGEEVANWLKEFAEEYVGTGNYQIVYSGNRSLHLHTDMWVRFSNLGKLKGLANSCMNETDAQLDTSVYSSVPQFRMMGAKHDRTGLYKVPIERDFSRSNLIRQSQSGSSNTTRNGTFTYYGAGNGNTDSLLTEIGNHLLIPLIKENADVERYSGKPFSPYAKAEGGECSICILSVMSETVEEGNKHYARGYIDQAVGADGQFERYNSYSKVLLSQIDARKWDFQRGESVVIIGGRSHNSKMFEIGDDEVALLKEELQNEDRQSALSLLERWGYDTGERVKHSDNYRNSSEGGTEAAYLKQQIDRGEMKPGYDGIFRVTCRLLKIDGWTAAKEWIERTLGEDFKPKENHERMKAIVEEYEDYNHVQIPPEPDSAVTESEI